MQVPEFAGGSDEDFVRTALKAALLVVAPWAFGQQIGTPPQRHALPLLFSASLRNLFRCIGAIRPADRLAADSPYEPRKSLRRRQFPGVYDRQSACVDCSSPPGSATNLSTIAQWPLNRRRAERSQAALRPLANSGRSWRRRILQPFRGEPALLRMPPRGRPARKERGARRGHGNCAASRTIRAGCRDRSDGSERRAIGAAWNTILHRSLRAGSRVAVQQRLGRQCPGDSFDSGVSQNDFTIHHEGPVASYVDDVYLSFAGAASFELFDINRVEVLRGPQGTLFGRNATGGLIHYVSIGQRITSRPTRI